MAEQILQLNNDLPTEDHFIDAFDDDDYKLLSYHHYVPSILDDLDWNDMTQMIENMDLQSGLNRNACPITEQQQDKILSTRHKFAEENLLLRASYKGYSFHTYLVEEFQEKASDYIHNTGIYNFINEVNPINPEVSHQCLNNMIKQIHTTLNDLLYSNSITDRQYILMHPKRSMVRLNYLHFVPDTHKEGEPLQPIIICKNGPTWNIIHYLSRIFWSMFDQMTHCQTFANSDDLVYSLEQYVQQGYLRETTSFITFNINNICTKFSHQEVIDTLEKFLHIYASKFGTVAEGLTNATILQLVRLVLQNQFFIYDQALYQQMYGSPSGSLLTIPLACIFVFYGQSSFSSSFIHTSINNKNELFGRCHEDIFFTWNGSKDQMQKLLNEIVIDEQQYQNISPPLLLTAAIGTTVFLLDLELGHDKHGHLLTKIYRDPKTDEHELPNQFQYHTCQPINLIKAALKHAVQCCSHEKDFQHERRHLQLCHLFHGFSLNCINQCIIEFYNELGFATEISFRFPNISYQTLRQRVLNNYQQQIALKKQQQHNEEQDLIRIVYANDWNVQRAIKIKNDLLHILNDTLNNKDASNDMAFECIKRPHIPLTIQDYLVDKRPPLRLLTLPDNEQDE